MTRKVVYCEAEGGLYLPWVMKPRGFLPPITIWANGRIEDKVLENYKRVKRYKLLNRPDPTRKKLTRRQVREIEQIASENIKGYHA